jgi:hypothetical protein
LPSLIVGQAELDLSLLQLTRPNAAMLPRIIAERVKRDLVVILRFLSKERPFIEGKTSTT